MTTSLQNQPVGSRTRRVIRASATYDLIVTAGFAFPFSAPALLTALSGLHSWLALPGTGPAPDLFTVLFANLMGSIVVVWSVFRLLRPSYAAGAADVAARVLFSLGMGAALVHGASPVLAVMLTLELAWAIVQAIALGRAGRNATAPRALTADAAI